MVQVSAIMFITIDWFSVSI